MATSSRRSRAPVLPISSSFISSIPPASTFSSTAASAATAFASSSSTFSSSSSAAFFHRSSSPTRVNIVGTIPFSSSIRFSSSSPSRSLTFAPPSSSAPQSRRTCMCSPTTHPGSFQCSLHKGFQSHDRRQSRVVSSPSYRLNARRSAMTNSLVRIGTVEGDLVKRALAALIRPSSHQQRRRSGFQPLPSRLSVMSKADDL